MLYPAVIKNCETEEGYKTPPHHKVFLRHLRQIRDELLDYERFTISRRKNIVKLEFPNLEPTRFAIGQVIRYCTIYDIPIKFTNNKEIIVLVMDLNGIPMSDYGEIIELLSGIL